MFDDFLRKRSERTGEPFVPFDPIHDYDTYVDGLPRSDGVRSFLVSRRIELPEGGPNDPPDTETIAGLGNRKNEIVLRLIREEGVEPYEGSVRYVEAVRGAGLRCAVVSSSANCRAVLEGAGIADLFDEVVDGVVLERQHLKGKPAPDSFVFAARALGVEPEEAAVFEDALAGVAAGRAGGFGFVVGVDRVGQAEALREHGADIVVRDLAELLEQ
jgi:HAD superfamily hydrolase (TIGR01509 family)